MRKKNKVIWEETKSDSLLTWLHSLNVNPNLNKKTAPKSVLFRSFVPRIQQPIEWIGRNVEFLELQISTFFLFVCLMVNKFRFHLIVWMKWNKIISLCFFSSWYRSRIRWTRIWPDHDHHQQQVDWEFIFVGFFIFIIIKSDAMMGIYNFLWSQTFYTLWNLFFVLFC